MTLIDDPRSLVFESVRELDASETYKDLLFADVDEQIRAILSISWHDNWRFAQDVCFKYARHHNPDVRNISITGLGHVARIHGAIDIGRVLELVSDLHRDGHDHSSIEDMFTDIMIFAVQQGRRTV